MRPNAAMAEEGAHEFGRTDRALMQRPGHSQQVVPIPRHEFGIRTGTGNAIEDAIVGRGVESPKLGFANIGHPRTELVPQEPK